MDLAPAHVRRPLKRAGALGASTTVTLNQLKSWVASSATLSTAPNLTTSVPTYSQLATSATPPIAMTGGRSFPWACTPEGATSVVPTNASTLCSWGDRTSSKIVVLTGDSQAGMWLPALDYAGRTMHFRAVLLAEPGCPAWGDPGAPGDSVYATITVASCDAWRASVVAYAKQVHPYAVLLAGDFRRSSTDTTVTGNTPFYLTRVGQSVTAFRASGAKVAFVGAIPQLGFSIVGGRTNAVCLSITSPVTKCELAPSVMIDALATTVETKVSTAKSVKIIPTSQMICTTKRCVIFVKGGGSTHLVFADNWHVNRYFAAWTAPAFTQLMQNALK